MNKKPVKPVKASKPKPSKEKSSEIKVKIKVKAKSPEAAKNMIKKVVR